MKYRLWILFVTLSLTPSSVWAQAADASAVVPATLTQDQLRDLIHHAAEKDIENDKAQRDYTYIEREQEHKLNGKGELQSTELRTYEVMMIYGEHVRKLIAKDDKPLSAKDAAKEDEQIEKVIDKRKDESDGERNKRLEKEEKDREEDRQFVREISEAYNFRLASIEPIEGRDTYVIDADPRSDFQPQSKEAKMLPKFRFRVWIDKVENQWVKVDVQCIDTVSIGWVLARLHKGSNIVIEQTRVNDEVWLPKHVVLKLDARLALLKGINVEEDVSYRDFKKFHADTKIVPGAEVEDAK